METKRQTRLIDKRYGIRYYNFRRCKKCNHTMLLGNCEKLICTWCGNYIYKNEKIEFIHKLRQELLKH